VEVPRRAVLARYAAPAAFLLALTIALLLVRAGLSGGDGGGDTKPLTRLVTEQRTTTKTTRAARTTRRSSRRFYTIQAGDTLDVVAAKFHTTTEQLLALNPGIDPHALTIGQKVRVR
jgi:LysM repeat protein